MPTLLQILQRRLEERDIEALLNVLIPTPPADDPRKSLAFDNSAAQALIFDHTGRHEPIDSPRAARVAKVLNFFPTTLYATKSPKFFPRAKLLGSALIKTRPCGKVGRLTEVRMKDKSTEIVIISVAGETSWITRSAALASTKQSLARLGQIA